MFLLKVKPTDKKPLNICVQCIYKLKQFTDLINCSSNNDKDFDLSKKLNKSVSHFFVCFTRV